MAVNPSARTDLSMSKRWRDRRETSPERTKLWIVHRSSSDRKVVPVVYYLCRNGHLEHPHFMEVPLSSIQGLILKDVMNRLDFLRGKGMANLYSWASKRSYRTGFVWQDLSENDIIHPAYGHEYVLKGSELLESCSSFRSQQQDNREPNSSGDGYESPTTTTTTSRRKNQSWSSFDPREYKVYKTESANEDASAGKSIDAATQTDDDRRRRRALREEEEEEVEAAERIRIPDDPYRNSSSSMVELSREEVSPPPPSSSSTEASETASGGAIRSRSADIRDQTAGNDRPSGRMKASAVLMQLISCVSGSVKPGESTLGKDHKCPEGAEYGARLQRDAWNYKRA